MYITFFELHVKYRLYSHRNLPSLPKVKLLQGRMYPNLWYLQPLHPNKPGDTFLVTILDLVNLDLIRRRRRAFGCRVPMTTRQSLNVFFTESLFRFLNTPDTCFQSNHCVRLCVQENTFASLDLSLTHGLKILSNASSMLRTGCPRLTRLCFSSARRCPGSPDVIRTIRLASDSAMLFLVWLGWQLS